MKANLIVLIVSITLVSCATSINNSSGKTKYHDIILSAIDTTDYLTLITEDNQFYELGVPFAFIDKRGDTLIPFGKYSSSWTNTLTTFAIVTDTNHTMIGIDRNDNLLFEVFKFDNGPDYTEEGLFRVIRNGKIGYANENGEVVIPCQFDCAYYFEDGKAKVSNNCKELFDGEYHKWESNSWYFIDKRGKRIE